MRTQGNRQEVRTAPLFGDTPFALSIGPQRTGTSWLDRYLRARGDVCLPTDIKEVFFFDRHYARGGDFYKAQFNPDRAHKLVMEISTTAFDHTDAPQRVYDLFGSGITLVCPLRHPVSRSYSLYRHFQRYGFVNGDLRRACEAVPQILTTSRYSRHLAHWGERFGLENINFVFQEDLEDNRDAFIRRICRILRLDYKPADKTTAPRLNSSAVPPVPLLAGAAQNAAQWARDRELYGMINIAKQVGLKSLVFGRETPEGPSAPIPPDDLAWLSERLSAETQNLETLLGHPLPQWRNKKGTE